MSEPRDDYAGYGEILETLTAERDVWQTRAEQAEAALREIAEQQPKTLAWLRANSIVFDGPLGTDPNNWEHVAFSIYNDLCEVDAIARREAHDE